MSQQSSHAIAERLAILRQEIPAQVKLIAVSKQVSSDQIREAYAAGVRDFGESRAQEAIAKQQELQDLPDITWHFIGRLQANKARKVLKHFHWIHSVDGLKLAERLNYLSLELNLQPKICLQIKLIPDPHKQGWSEAEFWEDFPALCQLHALQIQGLMIIPPTGTSDRELENLFQKAQNLIQQIESLNEFHLLSANELSMGMSGDYQLAIAHGSTLVRLGQVIFGSRL